MVSTEIQSRLSPAQTHAAAFRAGRRLGEAAEVCEIWRADSLPYRDAWTLQQHWVELRKRREIPDRMLFVEHPPVITLGRNARREHLRRPEAELLGQGIDVVETNRGGGVTFHGPGQLVGYPVVDLSLIRKDVGWYLRTLEESLIRTLRELALPARRRDGMTGVWIGNCKVAAIGVHLSRWVTSHGFALNVETNLAYYRNIVPCGITAYPVSSLLQLTGNVVSRSWLEQSIATHLGDLLGRRMEWIAPQSGEGSKLCPPPTC